MRSLVITLAALLLAAPVPAQVAGFDAFFRDETMRVDYHHFGHATEDQVALDRIWRQGSWAGSRRHLVDPFEVGGHAVKVFDAASGSLLFSRGFDSYFGEYRTTAPAARGVRRSYHESALIPYPKKKIRFAIEARDRDGGRREIFSTEIDPADLAINAQPLDAGVVVVESHRGGHPHASVDVAILGEGYTASQEAKFRADLERFTRLLFAYEPFASLRGRFNVRGVLRPSQESGCDEPSRGVWRNTALSASFDSLGSERYMLTEDNRALRDVAAHVPYDVLYVMVNHERYGGGGIYNLFCTFTTDNQWHEYIFIHEFGHAFAGLADEYYTSSVAYNDFYPRGIEPVEPNITALLDPSKLKWSDLATPGIAIPTPWEKPDFDALDIAFQRVREEVNAKIARLMRQGAPAGEVAAAKAEAERLSAEHAKKMDAYLASSRFIGAVGAFEGAGYAAQGLYRPALDCMMFSKGAKPFCPVCQRHIASVVEKYTE